MKSPRAKSTASPVASGEFERLRLRLAEAEETLRAIRAGEVDTVLVEGQQGPQVFTLEGAGHAYRMLIESMNEGALTLTADKMILYANECFARMVKCPLEQVTGSNFRRFLSEEDAAALRRHMKTAATTGVKMQVTLQAADGSQLPAQISVREMDKDSTNRVTIGMVVTDVTESKRTEALLRSLMQRVVQVQEAERERVAMELHDNITQQLCAVLFQSQALADSLSKHAGPAKVEALKLREMLGQTAGDVERISQKLRSSVLEHLGLAAVLRDTSTEFSERTGVIVKLACVPLTLRPPAATELALYRILEEALKNIDQHARAKHVTVGLTKEGDSLVLKIKDDGIGFDSVMKLGGSKGKGGLGLLGMRERAGYVGGTFSVLSVRASGTTIEVRVPLETGDAAAA